MRYRGLQASVAILLVATATAAQQKDGVPAASRGPTRPNEPQGYVTLIDEDFAAPSIRNSGGQSSKHFKVVREQGGLFKPGKSGWPYTLQITPEGVTPAPTGNFNAEALRDGSEDGYVAAIEVPQGWNPRGSEAPSQWGLNGGFGKQKAVYLMLRFKLSANYAQWNGNKIGYIYAGKKSPLFIALEPQGAFTDQGAAQRRPIRIRVGLQGVLPQPSTGWATWNAEPNVGMPSQAIVSRGNWHTIEMQLVGNTPGQVNGQLRLWLDGAKIIERGDVGYFGGKSSTEDAFTTWSWKPTHNGFKGQPYQFSVYQAMDRFYVSAAP